MVCSVVFTCPHFKLHVCTHIVMLSIVLYVHLISLTIPLVPTVIDVTCANVLSCIVAPSLLHCIRNAIRHHDSQIINLLYWVRFEWTRNSWASSGLWCQCGNMAWRRKTTNICMQSLGYMYQFINYTCIHVKSFTNAFGVTKFVSM